ncbi:MAG: efflux transporter periplasmic adaptor subunit [Verrucomicrobiales bacterium]|nr:efflux transporter periplasmic adaptor subunit [Verrucomicrobiales bacterium]
MESSTKPNRTLLKISLTLGVLAVGAAGTMLTIKFKTKAESKPTERKLPSVRVVKAKPGSHTYQIQSQGTALPRTTIRLVSEVSGKVVSVSDKFDAGQVFKKDDVLLTIDSRDYELALAQAEASVAQADLRLQMEEKEAAVVQREWRLLNQGKPSGLQAREPQLAQARAALAAAKAAKEAAQRNVERCEIRAPFDGMVTRASVRPGQFVSLATPLGEIFSTDFAEVRLPLAVGDLDFIELPAAGETVAPGQAPRVTLTSEAGGQALEWQGRLVRSEETIDPVNRMVYVVARVEDPYRLAKRNGAALRRGTFVKATITGRKQENVVSLERTALRGKDVVWVAQDGRLSYRKVKVAYADKEKAILSEGLKSGEQVITSLLGGVIDGMGIEVQADSPANP